MKEKSTSITIFSYKNPQGCKQRRVQGAFRYPTITATGPIECKHIEVTIQIIYLRDLFSKLAHCSIMKLDQASMDKMFYLMLLSVKKEVFLTSSPF